MASLDQIARPFLNLNAEDRIASDSTEKLDVRPKDHRNRVVNLSGRNQQKIVLAKWLMRDCDILLFDEPTRGIDVGAKFQIYSLIAELATMGKCIIVASSEVDEINGICTRVLVMRRGKIVETLMGNDISRVNVLSAVTGSSK